MRALTFSVSAFVLFSGTAFSLTECSGSSDASSANGGDGGTSTNGCPTDEPTVNAACAVAQGVLCSYGESNSNEPANCSFSNTYNCLNGVWNAAESGGPSNSLFCPGTIPEAGSPCVTPSDCPGVENECPFDCPNGPSQVASCQGDHWVVPECTSPVDASDTDASSDAGDGGD